jgi:hypothetical protein
MYGSCSVKREEINGGILAVTVLSSNTFVLVESGCKNFPYVLKNLAEHMKEVETRQSS